MCVCERGNVHTCMRDMCGEICAGRYVWVCVGGGGGGGVDM